MSTAEIRAAALALPEDERERLVLELWDSLSEEDGVGEAWATEIERRVEAIANGDVKLVDHEEVKRRVFERLDSLRR